MKRKRLSTRQKYSIFFSLAVIFLLIFFSSLIVLNEIRLSQTSTSLVAKLFTWPEETETASSATTTGVVTEANESFKICLVGDNNLATMPDLLSVDSMYGSVITTLQTCDILVGNLECNIATPGTGSPQAKGYTYTIGPEAAAVLAQAGFDAVTLANNHTMDYGPAALLDEIRILGEQGIMQFGGGNNTAEAFAPKYLVYNDTRIAFLSYNTIEYWITSAQSNQAGTAYFDYTQIVRGIQEARANADLVIVYPHWGEENKSQFNNLQRYWAHVFIDNGADLVVGAGPHVRQDTETYNGKTIYYSIGNFAVRGFAWLPEGNIGTIVEITVSEKKISEEALQTINISFPGTPYFAE